MPALDFEAASDALRALRGEPLPTDAKGFGHLAGRTPADIAASGLTLADLELPVAVIDIEAMTSDIRTLAIFARDARVELAPHIKTSMSPHVFVPQLEAGAWGATVATVQQARVAARFGVRRLIIANEIGQAADATAIVQLLMSYDDLAITCFADSMESVDLLASGFSGSPRPLGVMVEMGAAGGRAGCRSVRDAEQVGRAIHESPALQLVGVSAFEGVLASNRELTSRQRVADFMRTVVEVGDRLVRLRNGGEESPPIILSAGGSVFFDVVQEELSSRTRYAYDRSIVLRSGAYVVHDQGYLSEHSPFASEFESALSVRATVISLPEPGLAIVGAGKRDIGSDLALPKVQSIDGKQPTDRELVITSLNDQHSYLRWPPATKSPVKFGSVVTLAAAHPCTTFDRWRYIALANRTGQVVDVARTYF